MNGEYAILNFTAVFGDPYCVRQLADVQAHMEQFEREHVDVITLSVDPLDKAREMVEHVHATFPIAYGLQVSADAEKVGAYWEERR